ncbi:unnamed protein product [Rangifer tarandus platyrhynchus]|uniref:Uncharacterized protein n=2 Tax=Rangifer tarandus platyrhynchus TaxID=3082113 RepID=A0ABN8ZLJ7_RANTA|nr:unnamed protein product [Rangifer tarandus platyrhynchus]CAI9708370.1 unnamed protein product [Rangifer tarandus platyrhynchus]
MGAGHSQRPPRTTLIGCCPESYGKSLTVTTASLQTVLEPEDCCAWTSLWATPELADARWAPADYRPHHPEGRRNWLCWTCEGEHADRSPRVFQQLSLFRNEECGCSSNRPCRECPLGPVLRGRHVPVLQEGAGSQEKDRQEPGALEQHQKRDVAESRPFSPQGSPEAATVLASGALGLRSPLARSCNSPAGPVSAQPG